MFNNEMKAKNSSSSSYREKVLEHLFVGEIMRCAWFSNIKRIEILKPEVDDGGYDLVVEANNILRHIQLKATFQGSKVARFNIHLGLANKPGGCVIVLLPDPQTLKIEKFLWFGGLPGQKLPDISRNAIGKHAKGNSHGTKTQRPMIRIIPRGTFARVDGVGAIMDKLFGIGCSYKPHTPPSLPVEQPQRGSSPDKFPKINRIELWANRLHQANHKIIKAYLQLEKGGTVRLDDLKRFCSNKSISEYYVEKFDGHYASMKTDSGKSHGNVFNTKNGVVSIHPRIREEIKTHFEIHGNKVHVR